MLLKNHRIWATMAVVPLLFTPGADGLRAQSKEPARVQYAGVRSSIYGMRDAFPTPEGWAKAIDKMMEYFPGSQGTAIWIVGALAPPGCRLEFPKDPADSRSYDKVQFLDYDRHEPYLDYFDKHGIKVYLQVEPGYADVETLIDLVLNRYGKHVSVVGFGVDVEWYQGIETDSGIPVADDVAMRWEARVKAHDKAFRLFLKHYDQAWLGQKYRGDIVFVDDSQQFADTGAMVKEFAAFAEHFYPNPVMYQIGYGPDKKWWGQLTTPPKDLGDKLAAVTRQECGIIWVDFTLRDVLPYK